MSHAAYIHGYSSDEQDRLYRQARLLEPMVFDGVDFASCRSVLEVGCGVGAQSLTLLERFPGVKLSSVDLSEAQLARAREHLKDALASGRVTLERADAGKLPYASASFDGAFVCWVLEHTAWPGAVLRELRRVLRPDGVLHGIEVMNANLHVHPDSPALMSYWDALNAAQRHAGGDPDVGAKLGNLLKEAGFSRVETRLWTILHDQRDRAALSRFIDYWEALLLSAAPQLVSTRRVHEGQLVAMREELARLKTDPRAVFYYAPVKFSARA